MSRRAWWFGTLAAFAAFAGPAAAAVTGWGQPQAIPDSEFQEVERLTLRADGGVDVHLAFPTGLARRSASGTWTTVFEPGTNEASARAINASGGRVALVRSGSPRAEFRVAGLEHTQPLDSGIARFPVVPIARLSDSGHGLLAWVDVGGAISAIYHAAGGAGWEAPLVVVAPQADRPRAGLGAAVAENGAAVVVWTEEAGSTTVVRAIHRSGPGVAWSGPQTVVTTSARIGEQSADDQARVLLGLDGVGNATIVWGETPERTTRVLRSSSLDQATGVWTSPVELARAATVAEQPIVSLDVAADGHAIAGWWTGTTRSFDVWVSRRAPGGLWESHRLVAQGVPFERVGDGPGAIPDDNNRRPRVAIAPGGSAIVAWARSPGSGLAPVPQASLGTADGRWSIPRDLSDPKRDSHGVVDDRGVAVRITDGVDIDASGHAFVAWASYGDVSRVLVAETSPPVPVRARRPVRLLKVTVPVRPPRAGSTVPMTLRLNVAVENVSVLVERRTGHRWVRVARARVGGFGASRGGGPEVQIRPPSPGAHDYRARLLGPGVDHTPRSVVVRAVAAVPGTVQTCDSPVAERGASDGSIWLLCRSARSFVIQRVRPVRRAVSRSVAVGSDAVDLAISTGTVWVLRHRSVLPVAVGSATASAPVELALDPDEQAIAVAVSGPSVWVLTHRIGASQRLLVVDAASMAVSRTIELTATRGILDLVGRPQGVFLVVYGGGSGDPGFRVSAHAVDTAGNVAQPAVPQTFGDLDSGPAGVWASGTFVIDADHSNVLTQLEPRQRAFPNALKSRRSFVSGSQLAVGTNAVWALIRGETSTQIMRVNPATGRVIHRSLIPPFEGPLTALNWDASPHLVAAGRRAWIVDRDRGVLVPAG